MAVHYLTKPEIIERFSKHIGKRELEIQTLWSTITLNGDQIVIIEDPKFSKMGIDADTNDKAWDQWFEEKE